MNVKNERAMMARVEKFYVLIIAIIMPTFSIVGKAVREDGKIEQIKVGNFALPLSQQAGPLFSFGQNIIDKGDSLLLASFNQLRGSGINFKEVTPAFLYGITDNFSLFLQLPIAANFKFENSSSHGLEDFLVQFEYAFYTKETTTIAADITCVANIGIPTGSAFKEPFTGFGAPSFFLGLTAGYATPKWYFFTEYGVDVTTSHKKTKFGNQFLYEFGLTRNIWYKPDKWLFNVMVEFDGTYRQRNKILGSVDCNSGGNIILFGPSLWFSTQRLILEIGIDGVVFQHLFGDQPKEKYIIATTFGWTF